MLRFTACDLVRDLKALLTDRYRDHDGGVAIFKELIQNADDAGATSLHVAHFAGSRVGEGVNPLCGRPGLLIVNDAPFEERHRTAFTSFSTSSKDGEETQIGRFGIGRKSLFHWAEVLFFLGTGRDGALRGGLINPWAEQVPTDDERNELGWRDPLRPQWLRWKRGGEEEALLRERVRLLLGEGSREPWFAVWLPSRDASDRDRALSKVCTSADTLPLTRGRLDAVARLLPQLAHVRRVFFHVVPSNPADASMVRERGSLMRVGTGLGRPGPAVATRTEGAGIVQVALMPEAGAREAWELHYSIVERMIETAEMAALKRHENWPTEPPENLHDPDATSIPAKAASHGATTVILGPPPIPGAESPELRIHNAIFLPLSGAAALEKRDLATRHDVSVLLHGYHFPDSGRQTIEGASEAPLREPDSAPGVRARWNRLITCHETLPTLLPALALALGRESVGPSDARVILLELNRSRLLQQYRQEITAESQLLLGPAMERPTLVSSAKRCLGLPVPAADEVNAALREVGTDIAGRFAIVWRDAPGVAAPRQPSPWSGDDIRAFGDRIKRYLRSGPSAWVAWMSGWAQESRDDTADALGAIALELYRACLQHKDWKKLLDHEAWRTIAARFLPGTTASLWVPPAAIEYFRTLRAPAASSQAFFEVWPVIVLPSRHLPSEEAPPLDTQLAVEALMSLSDGVDDAGRSALVAGLLGASDRRAVLRDPRVGSKRFVATGTTDASELVISLTQLQQASHELLAFTPTGAIRPQDLANRLAAAISGRPTIFLVKDQIIAQALEVPDLRSEVVTEAVLRHRLHDDPDARLPLLERVLTNPGGGTLDVTAVTPRHVSAARKLIAGEACPADDEALLFSPDGVSSALCEQLVDHPWQAVRPAIASFLKERLSIVWLRKLGVRLFDASAVIEVMERMHLSSRDQTRATLSTFNSACLLELARIVSVDEGLFRVLPMHRTRFGHLVSLDEGEVFLPSSTPVPQSLREHVRLIELPRDDMVARRLSATLRQWCPEDLLRVGLSQLDPAAILEGLGQVGALTSELEHDVREHPWLPLVDGRHVSPARVLRMPVGLEEHLQRVRGAEQTAAVLEREVAAQLRHHAHWPLVQKRMPEEADAVSRAFEEMCGREDLLARCRLCHEPAQLRGWVADKLASDPALSLWRAATEAYPPDGRWQMYQRFIAGPISAERALQLLRLASEGHAPDRPLEKDEIQWFSYALAAIARGRGGRTVPADDARRLRLPNAEDRLVASETLVQGGDAVPKAHAVHPELAKFFEPATIPASGTIAERRPVTLESLLAPWRKDGQTSRELLGFLVAPFALRRDAESEDLQTLFKQLRPSDSPREAMDELLALCASNSDDSSELRAGWGRYRFVSVSEGDAIDFTSVTGRTLSVRVHQPKGEIFVDPPSIRFLPRHNEAPPTTIRIWKLDPGVPAADRERMVLHAVESLLRGMFERRPMKERLRARFNQAAQESQELRLAQALLIDLLPPSLRRLGVHKRHPELAERLKDLDGKRHRLENVRQQAFLNDRQGAPLRDAESALEEARHALRKAIESDPSAQAVVLNALREEISKYQYQVDQVLFELAQNADDAFTQRASAAESLANPTFFVDASEDGRIVVRHDGRPINRCYVDEDREGRGWDRDLINMLSLGFSEKSEEDTGRFGLGFKSVYLITDAPRIQSDRLALRISGGVLPVPVAEGNHEVSRTPGTVFELPLRAGRSVDEVLGRFRRLAALLPIFAQTIQRVEIRTGDGIASLEPRVVARLPDAAHEREVVGVDVPTTHSDRDGDAGGRWVVVREVLDEERPQGPRRLVAFRVLGGRFIPTRNIPSLWVTVPTREDFSLGFLLGGSAGIDVGRSRLARESEQTTEALGRWVDLVQAGVSLLSGALSEESRPWQELFGSQATAASILGSLFEVLTSSLDHAQDASGWELDVVRNMLGQDLGRDFLNRVAIIPDASGVLRRAAELCRSLDEDLSNPRVWEFVQQQFPWDTPVVRGEVQGRLRLLGYGRNLPQLSLLDCLARHYPPGACLEASAASHLLALGALQDIVRTDTWGSLRERVCVFQLRAASGAWCPIRAILVADTADPSSQETLLAAFAPPARRLPPDASTDVIELIRLFRRRLSVTQSEIADWARAADGHLERRAVVTYMFEGEHRGAVVQCFHHDKPAWLTDELLKVVGHALGRPAHIIDALRVAAGTTTLGPSGSPAPAPAPAPLAVSSLADIHRWWLREGEARQKGYMRALYPHEWQDPGRLRGALRSGDRRAWMTLCVLAMCQRLGRARPEQHRSFVENHPEWIEVLAARTSSSDQWIELIDAWIVERETTEHYSLWIGLYPSFRRLWRVSQELFGLLGQAPPPHLSPDDIFRFRENPELTGTGVNLPRLSRAFGARGRAWLCRELVRLGVWEPDSRRYYHVPWRIMCLVLKVPHENAQSQEVGRALEEQIGEQQPFGTAFDLPFDILRFDGRLRRELVGYGDEGDGGEAFADDDDRWKDSEA
jgi:hypothetical protein